MKGKIQNNKNKQVLVFTKSLLLKFVQNQKSVLNAETPNDSVTPAGGFTWFSQCSK